MTALRVGVRNPTGSMRKWQLWALPPLAVAYILTVIILALTVTAIAGTRTQWHRSGLLEFAALLASGAVTIEAARTVHEIPGVLRAAQTVWYLATAIALPPVYALIAPLPLGAYRMWRVPPGMIYRRVFSNATISLAYGCASQLFHSEVARIAASRAGAPQHLLAWVAGVAGCGITAWLINNGLLLGAIRAADPHAHIRDMFANRQDLLSDLVELNLAVLASFLAAVSWHLVALALLPVALYRRYLLLAQIGAQPRTDHKTGLLNTAAWQREAEVELARALRGGTPLAVAVAGIDHLADLGSMPDQEMRDQLDRGIAGMFLDQLPGRAHVGRLDCGHFAILLPQTDQAEAQRITEKLRDHVAAEPIAIESGGQEGFVFRLTISIGLAVLTEAPQGLAELTEAAESALGQASKTGWSKVHVLSESQGEQ